MNYESVTDFLLSPYAIDGAIGLGGIILGATTGIFAYRRWFSKNSIEDARSRKEVRLSKQKTKRIVYLAKQDNRRLKKKIREKEIDLENKKLDHERVLFRMQIRNDEVTHRKEEELIKLKHSKKLEILEKSYNHQEKIARAIVEMKGVMSESIKAYANAAANADPEAILERRRIRRRLYAQVDQNEEFDERTQYVPPAQKISQGQRVHPPNIVAQIENEVNAQEPLAEGLIHPFFELFAYMVSPSQAVKEIIDEAQIGLKHNLIREKEEVPGIPISEDTSRITPEPQNGYETIPQISEEESVYGNGELPQTESQEKIPQGT